MKLFIKRNVSTDNNIFTIFDDKGIEKYYVINKNFKTTKAHISLKIIDSNKNTVAKINKIPLVTTNSYTIKANNNRITLVCVMHTKGINCHYYGNNWHINGSPALRDFKIIDVGNSLIASQRKNNADCELNITKCENELFSIATSVCINLINTVDNLATQTV